MFTVSCQAVPHGLAFPYMEEVMSKTNYIASMQGMPILADRAKKTENGVNIDSALGNKQDSLGINSSTGDAAKFLNEKGQFVATSVSVSDNNPTLSWGNTSKVGTVGSTDLRVTMPANPASGKQDALATQTAYSSKGTATKVPQITTNSLGQVTGITEVTISGVTPASHTHGNIQNGGTLQTNDVTIASGDKLIVTDSSDSSKIARTSVSFDGSTTTTALTPKGTFESFAKASDITTAIQALDVSSVGGAGKYISAISEADGKISATATSMDTTPTASSTNAVTSGGIATALSSKLNTTGDASNTTASFTKSSGDTSSMASGGKLSAIFTTISRFFSAIALSLSDKADKVSGSVSGLLAALNSDGNLISSGISAQAVAATVSAIGGKQEKLPTSGEAEDTYAINILGTATSMTVPRSSGDYNSDLPGANKVKILEKNSSSGHRPTNAWFYVLSLQGDDTSYGCQLALPMQRYNNIWYRVKNAGEWQDWTKLANAN